MYRFKVYQQTQVVMQVQTTLNLRHVLRMTYRVVSVIDLCSVRLKNFISISQSNKINIIHYDSLVVTVMSIEDILSLDKANQIMMKMKHEYDRKNANKIKSKVWQLFTLIFDKRDNKLIENYVRCQRCSKFVAYNGVTTSKLLNHKCQNLSQPTIQGFLSISNNNGAKFSKNDIDAVRDAAAKFVVKDIRPFYAVEGEGLQDLIKTIAKINRKHPNLSDADIERLIPSRKVVRSHVDVKGILAQEIIKKDLVRAIETTGGFCLMIDLYTDKFKSNSYLGMVAKLNFIEGDEIYRRVYVLNLDVMRSVQKRGEEVRNEIIKILKKFDLTEQHMIENITWITDRGGNIRVALEKCVRINCFSHLINNLVEHMCKHVKPVKDLISDAASLVRYLKKSGLSIQKFHMALQSYCETRWNTVYYLLKSINDNYASIMGVLLEKEAIAPLSNVTEKLTLISKLDLVKIADFLELFTSISVHAQGDKYETLHTVWPCFHAIKNHLEPNRMELLNVKSMKAKGREYIEKILDDFAPKMIHKIAVFLHPALKKLNCASELEKEEIIEHVKSVFPHDEIGNLVPVLARTNSIETNDNTHQSHSRSISFFQDFINRRNESSNEVQLISNWDEIDNYIKLEIPMVRK